MTVSLPPGWAETTLGQILEPRREMVMARSNGGRYLGLEHVEPRTTRILGRGDGTNLKGTAVKFQAGDTLYARLRPYLNKICVPDFGGIASGEFVVFPAVDWLAPKFLMYFLNQLDVVAFANARSTGTHRPRIKWEDLSTYPVLLPPLAEQRRIVVAIEEQFSRIDAGVDALKRARRNLQQMWAAVLQAAVNGKLTEDWRRQHPVVESAAVRLERLFHERRQMWEEQQFAKYVERGKTPPANWKDRYRAPTAVNANDLPELAAGWCWVTLEFVAMFQNGRSFPSEEYSSEGIKLLRPGNLFTDGSVQWTDKNTRRLPTSWGERFAEYIVRGGELIVNLTAQSLKDEFLGRTCLTGSDEMCLLNQRLARISPVPGVDPRFLMWVLKSPVFRRFVNRLNTGSLIEHMFTSQLDGFRFPLPPHAEQLQIVSDVERWLSIAGEIDRTIESGLLRAVRLRQGILESAFSGCLVSQDSSDESAEVLLDRVKASRAVHESAAYPRRRSRR